MNLFLRGTIESILSLIVLPLVLFVSLLIKLYLYLFKRDGEPNNCWKPTNKFSILVTGASSGIGRSLVLEYAKRYAKQCPQLNFGLLGTNIDRLKSASQELQDTYGIPADRIMYKDIDITEEKEMEDFILKFEKQFDGINLLVANAAVSEYVVQSQEPSIDFNNMERRIMNVNFVGCLNTIMPILNQLVQLEQDDQSVNVGRYYIKKRYKNGQPLTICLVSSMSAEVPFVSMYGVMKKALLEYGRRLRWQFLKSNPDLNITVVMPGWVETYMSSKYPGFKNFMISSEKAAELIRDGIEKGDEVIYFPFVTYLLVRWMNVIPLGILSPIIKILPNPVQ